MGEITFKRKFYDEMLEWEKNSNGKSALMIDGARRVGKSTIAEENLMHIQKTDNFQL